MKFLAITLRAILFLFMLKNLWDVAFYIQRISGYYIVGFRTTHQLVSTCQLNDNIIIREYISRGSHATTSDANSIYAQIKNYPIERLIWSAYSSPFVKEIECLENNLIIKTTSNDPDFMVYEFSIEKIRIDLINEPIKIYKGRYHTEEEISYQKSGNFISYGLLIFNIIIVFLFGFMFWKNIPLLIINKLRTVN